MAPRCGGATSSQILTAEDTAGDVGGATREPRIGPVEGSSVHCASGNTVQLAARVRLKVTSQRSTTNLKGTQWSRGWREEA